MQATPAAPHAPHPSGTAPVCVKSTAHKEMPTMDETARRRTARHTAVRNGRDRRDADRRNAAAALQRALDRRDNGGATGH